MQLDEYDARALGRVAAHLDTDLGERGRGVSVETATFEVFDTYEDKKPTKYRARRGADREWLFTKVEK